MDNKFIEIVIVSADIIVRHLIAFSLHSIVIMFSYLCYRDQCKIKITANKLYLDKSIYGIFLNLKQLFDGDFYKKYNYDYSLIE